jgi:phosphoenolpyruvate-protein kinase (PTS system EI component)
MTVEAAHSHGKWVGICGELAGDPQAVPILIAMGVDELSMSPAKMPRAKQIILSM